MSKTLEPVIKMLSLLSHLLSQEDSELGNFFQKYLNSFIENLIYF